MNIKKGQNIPPPKEEIIQNDLSSNLSKPEETPTNDAKPDNEVSLIPGITNDSVKTESATEGIKEAEEPVTAAVAEPINSNIAAVENDDYSELDPDAPAVEEDEQEVPQPLWNPLNRFHTKEL